MRCPRDKQPLKRKISERMIGDGCDTCNGIFLTGNKTQSYQHAIQTQLLERNESTKPSGDSTLLCPDCHMAMNITFVDNIEIDICNQCLGVWFDKTEVQAVINRYNHDNLLVNNTSVTPYPSEFVHLLAKWFLQKPQT